jgi:hypothetical protein
MEYLKVNVQHDLIGWKSKRWSLILIEAQSWDFVNVLGC